MNEDAIRDRCGLFGIWGVGEPAEYVYLGLHNLQHRGQESCGIVTTCGRKFKSYYGMGIVNEVFTEEILSRLKGKAAIGYNRYSTLGASAIENSSESIL